MIKVGIDIGNSKISIVVCDIRNDGSKKILSFLSIPNTNLKKGLITNVPSMEEEVRNIIKNAAKESQTDIKSVNLNIPSIESKSIYKSSEINILGEMINDLHLKKTINQSGIFETIEGYETLQFLVTSYEIDRKFIYENPTGTYGDILKSNFYKYIVKKNIINTYSKIFENSNIYIENLIPTPLSSSLAVLNPDDKNLGAICIDLGASSSSISIFENEKIIYIDSINIGGKNITNDIARGVSTNFQSAERLKTLYGSVISSPSDENEIIEVQYMENDPSNSMQINRETINSIIKPRVEETLEMIWQNLKNNNLHKKKIKNVILTGGGSLLEGISNYAQIIFDSNVRIGYPINISGLEKKFLLPQFSQTIGSILYDKSHFEIDFIKNKEKNSKNTVLSRFSSWLDQYI